MALISNYYNSFSTTPGSNPEDADSAYAQLYTFFLQGYANYGGYMIDLYKISNELYRSRLLEQTGYTYPNGTQIVQLTDWVLTNANAISGSTEDEKWAVFKSSFSESMQTSIQVIITYERGLSVPFDTFKALSTSAMATLILSLDTPPNDFWTPYVAYYKRMINKQTDGWLLFENTLSGDYQYAIALLDVMVQGEYVPLSFQYNDISELKQQTAQYLAKNAIGIDNAGATGYGNYAWFMGNLIRENAELTINSFISPDQYETDFLSRFRTEYVEGVKAFIQSLKDQNMITVFEDILNIPAVTCTYDNKTQTADPTHPQKNNVIILFTGKTGGGVGFDPVSIGDKFVIDLNDAGTISFTAITASSTDVYAGLANAINTATSGDWGLVSATSSPIGVIITANSNNIPFTLKHISLYSEINRLHQPVSASDQLYLPATHPIYLSFAQGWLNDANAINTNTAVTRTFRGQAFKLDGNLNNLPAAGIYLTIYDISGVDPVEIGTSVTDSSGYFSIAYSLPNAFVTTETVRLQAKDKDGNIIDITTDQEPNLFTDAANGTFEGDSDDWNLSLSTNIEIGENEVLGAVVNQNDDFTQSSGGWHSAYPTNNGNLITGLAGQYVFASLGDTIYSEDILVVGNKYRIEISVTAHGLGPALTLKDISGTNIYNFPFSNTGRYYYEFIAVDTAIRLYASSMTIDVCSLVEIIPSSNSYEGLNSPRFYLDASSPTTDIIFNGNTSVTLTAGQDYEIQAFVRFLSPITVAGKINSSGLFLRPLFSTFYQMDEVDVINGSKLIKYKNQQIASVTDIIPDQWYKITTRYNTGVSTSNEFGVSLTDFDLADFVPNFSFFIDQIKLTKVVADYKDITLNVNATSLTNVYAAGLQPVNLSLAIAQVATASLPQITNIFPGNVNAGDLFILDLNHEGSVSYKATTNIVADTVTGLVAAITADTADVTITTPTPAAPSTAQTSYLTVADIHSNAKYTFRLNGQSPVSYTAVGTSMFDIIAGIRLAIDEQTADLLIDIAQESSFSLPQIIHITPQGSLATGAKYILQINGTDKVEYVGPNIVTGLISAITTAGGNWDSVTATSGGSDDYIILTANQNNLYFTVQQLEGGWKSIYTINDYLNNRVLIGANANNTPFNITQIGGAFKSVTAAGHTSYLSVTGDANNVPFTIYTQVVKATDSTFVLNEIQESFDIVPSVELSDALLLKGIYTLADILSLGGLKNNLDGVLEIKVITPASSGVQQVTHINLLDVVVGDVIQLQIGGSNLISYVAQSSIYSEIVTALVSLITSASGGWDSVTPTSGGDYVIVTANANNTPFVITQSKIGNTATSKKLDAIASLYTVSADLDLEDTLVVQLISELIQAGFSSALAIADVDQTSFVSTVRKIVGDFNAARLYEMANVRRDISQQLVNQYMPASGTYRVSKSGMSSATATQLNSIIEERCACEDCDTAVSPIAYFADLSNYINKRLNSTRPIRGGESFKANLYTLSNMFYQDFIELPSSCDASLNEVCQTRIAIEVLRRYMSSHPVSEAQLQEYQNAVSDYVFSIYKYFLVSVGTSYDEISMISTETEKKSLAAKLSIDYTSNPDFLNKLFIAPQVLSMESWSDYKRVINGGIQPLITSLSNALSASTPPVHFDDFKTLSPEDLKADILYIDEANTFYTKLANLILGKAQLIEQRLEPLDIPTALKEAQKWDSFSFELNNLFSVNFQKSFDVMSLAWQRLLPYKDTKYNFTTFSTQDISSLISFLRTLDGRVDSLSQYNPQDFWLPFAAALKSKVEEFSLSERDLEELFGWPDTSRDAYSNGAKLGDDENIISRWSIRGAEWGKNTDAQGYVYLVMNEIDGVIELYKNSAKSDEYKVAVAFLDSVTAKFIISEYQDSGLSGEFIVTGLDSEANIYISVIPLLLSWQQNAIREKWIAEDAASDAFVIDPDLITLADINYPYNINTDTPEKPADFWQKRKDDLDDRYTMLSTARVAAITPYPYTEYGSIGSGAQQLDNPEGVIAPGDSLTLVVDKNNSRLQVYEFGAFNAIVSSGLLNPTDAVYYFDDYWAGRLVVVDSGNSKIKQYYYTGAWIDWEMGAPGEDLGTFTEAQAIAIGPKLDIFITDHKQTLYSDGTSKGRVQRFTLRNFQHKYLQVSELIVVTETAPATDVKQVTSVKPSRIAPGDTFKLTIDGTGVVSYTCVTSSPDEIARGLYHEISQLTQTQCIAENMGSYLLFTAISADTSFTITYSNEIDFPAFYHIAVDNAGNRFIPDRTNNRVIRLNDNRQVLQVYGNPHRLTVDLELFFLFHETAGNTARDNSGHAYNGTVAGTANWTSNGKTGGALALDGETNLVQVGTHTVIDGEDESKRTLELWFKAENKDADGYQVLYRQGDDAQGLNIYINEGLLYVGSYGTNGGAWSNFLSTNLVLSGTWQHIAVVFNNTPYKGTNKFRAFIDGVEFTTIDQGNAGASIEASDTPDGITIGALNIGSINFHDGTHTVAVADYFFKGVVDNFRIWNRALVEEEITQLYTRIENKPGSLFAPAALAVAQSGDLYVADTGNARVVKYLNSGIFALTFGEYGNAAGQFKSPAGIALDQTNGFVYVSDNINNTVQQFTDLDYLGTLSPDPAFNAPSAMGVNSGGILYVADYNNGKIKLFDRNRAHIDTLSTYKIGATEYNFTPVGLLVNAQDKLVVLNENSDLVLMEDKTHTAYVLNGSAFYFSGGSNIATDADGYIYVANSGNNIGRTRFPEQFTKVTVPAGINLPDSYFDKIKGIKLDPFGNLWIVDRDNNRVLKVSQQGMYLNDIGKSDGSTGTGNGEFNHPEYLTIDESGNVYVSDTGNNRIQKFDNSGEFLCKWEANEFSPALDEPTGISIDSDRKLYIAQRGTGKIVTLNTMQGANAVFTSALGIQLSNFLAMAFREKGGEDISDELLNYNLSYAEYRQLLKLVTLLDKKSFINNEQWVDFYNLLVQNYKNTQYTTWKTEETAAGIILSQDFFNLFTTERTFTNWRSDEFTFTQWQKTLQTRINEAQVLVNATQGIINNAEDELLVSLRDILISYSDLVGDTLLQKASYGTDLLLIDLKNLCCQHTTRVSQAIETFQNLMWGIRNGLITDTFSTLSIGDKTSFDEEWTWMGSYASWRAAQFVFMYPENLLLPSYSNMQSDGFQTLVDSIRGNPQVNSDSINEYVGSYYDYIDDIQKLSLLASCETAALYKKNEKGIRNTQEEYLDYLFMVAQGSKTNSFYFSTMNLSADTLAVDAPWVKIKALDGIKINRVVALKSVRLPNGLRYLTLFFLQKGQSTPTLSQIKYDLQKRVWGEEITEIDIPEFSDGFGQSGLWDIEVNAYNDYAFNTKGYIPSKTTFDDTRSNNLVVAVRRGHLCIMCYLNDDMSAMKQISGSSGMAEYGLTSNNGIPNRYVHEMYGFASDELFYKVQFRNWNADNYQAPERGRILYRSTELTDTSAIGSINTTESRFMVWPGGYGQLTAPVYFYVDRTAPTSQLKALVFLYGAATPVITNTGILIPNALVSYISVFQGKKGIYIIYQDGISGICVKQVQMSSSGQISLVPSGYNKVISLPAITKYPDPNNNNSFRDAAKQLYLSTQSDAWNYRYVDEVYYAVPMLVALTLQKNGDYRTALDWYRLVYDYSTQNRIDAPVYGLLAQSSMLNVIDDFENNRNYTFSADGDINYIPVLNPDKSGNSSLYCGNYTLKPSGWSGDVWYNVAGKNTIDLNDPAFSIDVFDPDFVAPTKIGVAMYGMVNGVETFHSVYSAYTSGNGWNKLNIQRDGEIQGTNVTSITRIKLTLINEGNLSDKVFYIDNFQTGSLSNYDKPDNWLSDPLNPHAIASGRPDSYMRYTIMSLASCMIAFADNEFTLDNVESVPRARLLYEKALELLDGQGLGGTQEVCRNLVFTYEIEVSDTWKPVWEQIKADIYKVEKPSELTRLLADISSVMESDLTEEEKIQSIRTMVNIAISDPQTFNHISSGILENHLSYEDAYMALQSDKDITNYLNTITKAAGLNYTNKVLEITGVKPEVLLSSKVYDNGTVMAQLADTNNIINNGIVSPIQITGSLADLESDYSVNPYDPKNPGDTGDLIQYQLKDIRRAISEIIDYKVSYRPSTNLTFCVPSNPVVDGLRLVAEVNLYKIRSCRNIAGQVRELSPFAAPTDAITGVPQLNGGAPITLPANNVIVPSIYRYAFLLDRSKQLVQLAQQVEASMLSTLEKLDAERYSVLRARQDVSLSRAGVRLQDLRVKEANDSVRLAELQKEKSELIYDRYNDWLNQGLLVSEILSLSLLTASAVLSTISASQATASIANLATSGSKGTSSFAQALSSLATVSSTIASYQRRAQEWDLQRDIAQKDIAIGNQQITISKDQVAIVGQERNIAQMQVDNAEATVDFLVNKFTNAELYDWMSNVLQGVYSFFLQQATASARLASNQLAFERQQVVPEYIKADYWQSPVDTLLLSGPGQDKSVDRKGLTGAERLLQDIYELDQYAISTDVRKLELTKTISLAAYDPSAFQRFIETGELYFDTTLALFDKDFPGHYLRLIRSVKTSLIALVSPVDGIKATLTNSGVSRVVVQGADFQKIQMQRPSETVALTSTSNATGLFEMSQIQNEKLLPFENTGVETQWLFRLPKAANLFDYSSIADLLITIEYTALSSDVYRNKVIKELTLNGYAAERPFSFRNNFADQWYDLNNPSSDEDEISVNFKTTKADFPVNIKNSNTTGLLMYFVISEDLDETDAKDAMILDQIKLLKVALNFTPENGSPVYLSSDQGRADVVNNMVSTRSFNGTPWVNLVDKGVSGTWTLSYDIGFSDLFSKGYITDILFVVSINGQTGSW